MIGDGDGGLSFIGVGGVKGEEYAVVEEARYCEMGMVISVEEVVGIGVVFEFENIIRY